MHYRGKTQTTVLPQLPINLSQKQSSRIINHTFNMDFNSKNAGKYFDLQKKNKDNNLPILDPDQKKMP